MSDYQLELKQVVQFPRCRIYRQFIRTLIEDRTIRASRGSGLFYFTVLSSFANFRTSYQRIGGINYTIYPGEWVCSLKEMQSWFRTLTIKQTIQILQELQCRQYIKFNIVGHGKVIKYRIIGWKKHNTVLDYNAPCYKDTGFFFIPISTASELIGMSRCSEMDVVLDLWINTIYNDEQVLGSDVGPVVYMRNGTSSPLLNYTDLGERWGISKATVSRTLKRLSRNEYISLFSYPGRHGSVADALTAPFDGSTEPIMNNDQAIVENIVSTNNELCVIIEEAYADLMKEIDDDFESSDGDIKEIINPYTGANVMNPFIVMSQFCASKDQSFEEISLENLVKIVRDNRDKLFSFRKETKWENRMVKETQLNPETMEYEEVEVEKMQLVVYYTFVYNGESYFADEIFQLTTEQKVLANDYFDNLMLYLEDKYHLLIGNPDFGDLIIDYPFTPVPGNFTSPLPSIDWRQQVSDEFGSRGGKHRGIDIAAPFGTPIHACKAGVIIVSSPWINSWGEYVVINHGDGLTTLYAHMSQRAAEVGKEVNQGDIIGYVGSTGVSDGNHLHLEISLDGVLQEPRNYLP